ncbi:putative integrase [Actinoplanes missouriensis 431]|uniref:Putative integrase n=1 Tax=Actinoplanes missouriensis (strain ATCC 14538 / DSM 43046 / CBS 188.64 / JCM 3121 / NBRC 102363 / NCIMB 12654 / NRRL B-3342 / UNCC 431) TaxID=512565 RepID=I0GXL2_ACTM4|nr:site-specific integrase [Actinoplanes missouriensis]KOX45246.1 hypothetical protein ADL19_23250 [Streptomyces purpurogeneiscleroticus]BAL85499.1 putative integrase [Actinoplanes missouriensis 431]
MWIEKHGPNWRIREEIAGRKTTLKSGFPTKTSAKAAMNAMNTDRARGDFINPQDGKVTLAQFVNDFWPGHETGLKPSSRRTQGSNLRVHVLPQLGLYRLDQIDTLVVTRFVHRLVNGDPDPVDGPPRKPLSPGSVRNVYGVLHTILGAATKARMIPFNPAIGVKMPPREHHEMKFCTPIEIERLLAACTGDDAHWRPLVMLLVTTGLRYGEAHALQVGKVDLFAGTVQVTRTAYEASGGRFVYTTPKTRSSRRTVRIPQELVLELAPLLAGKASDALVFTMPDGKPITGTFRKGTWKRITSRAGLTGLRLHDLRHTVASLLISANVPLTAIQRMLGHTSIKMTSDLYGHLMPEVNESIVDTLTEVLKRGSRRGGTTGIPAWPVEGERGGNLGGAWGIPALPNPAES